MNSAPVVRQGSTEGFGSARVNQLPASAPVVRLASNCSSKPKNKPANRMVTTPGFGAQGGRRKTRKTRKARKSKRYSRRR